MKIRMESLWGEKLNRYKKELAGLRIKVFREYPYLYDGTIEYEEKYLEHLVRSPESILVAVFDYEEVVGASTGMPLKDEADDIKKPWIDAGLDIGKIFYFSESVLMKKYRGQGIGVKFFEEREQWARGLNYEITTFCGVIREENYPDKPDGYVALDQFWRNRGYSKKEGLTCTMSWKQVRQSQESEQELQFWDKKL